MRRAFCIFAVLLIGVAAHTAAALTPAELVERGRFKEARRLLQPRLSANPNDAEANYLMARILLETRDFDRAQKLAEKAIQLNANSSAYHAALAEALGRQAERASIFRQLGIARNSKHEMERAIELDPRNFDAQVMLMNYLWEAPGIAGGDKDRARAIPQEFAKYDKAKSILLEAELAGLQKQNAQLESIYLRVVQAEPGNYQANINLARIYASDEQKKYEQAERYAKAALKTDSQRIAAYEVLARIYAVREQWAALDSVLAQSEKTVPENLAPHYSAARVLVDSGKDLPRAERYLRMYMGQEPELGAPSIAAAHWRLGLLFEKQGKKAEAIQELQTAAAADPKFEPAQKDLKRLKG